MEKDLDMKLYNEYLEGNKRAFELLYNSYKDKVQYFIFNIVKDYQRAEDITQDVFIYMMQNKFKMNCSFKTYLYIVAKSRAINYLKLENNKKQIDELYLAKEQSLIEQDIAEIINKIETRKEIIDAINELDDKYKNALYLTQIEELSYKETAEILGESIQNVKNLVHRGKKELRKILLKKGFDEMNKVSKVLIMVICITTVFSGIVYAGFTIYNEFIKKQDDIQTRRLFDLGDGYTYYDIDLMANDMTFNDEPRLYHKIITDVDDYNKYKERISEFPNVSEIDFTQDFVVVIANENIRQAHEIDLEISDIIADENNTNIIMSQKENPNLNADNNVWYAVVDRSLLRDNVNVTIMSKKINKDEYKDFSEISETYSNEDAINDNCIVIVNDKLVSNNLSKFEEFVRKTENNEMQEIRIFKEISDDYNLHSIIYDISYENGIYFVRQFWVNEQRENPLKSFTKIEKIEKEDFVLYSLRYDDGNSNLSSYNYLPIKIEK